MDDPPAFAPVPTTSTRRDGWTPERQRAFVAALAELGAVGAAARSVGMTPQTANRLRRRPGAEGFAAAWGHALGEGRHRARAEAIRRGLHGYLVPVRRNGQVTGWRHRVDNRLLFAACYGRSVSARDGCATDAPAPAPAPGNRAADPAAAFHRTLVRLERDLHRFPELSEPSAR